MVAAQEILGRRHPQERAGSAAGAASAAVPRWLATRPRGWPRRCSAAKAGAVRRSRAAADAARRCARPAARGGKRQRGEWRGGKRGERGPVQKDRTRARASPPADTKGVQPVAPHATSKDPDARPKKVSASGLLTR